MYERNFIIIDSMASNGEPKSLKDQWQEDEENEGLLYSSSCRNVKTFTIEH